VDIDKVLNLAQSIHKRRVFVAPEAPRSLSTAEAVMDSMYGLELDLDSYDDRMVLNVRDERNRKVCVVAYKRPPFRVDPLYEQDYDVIVFVEGDSLDEVDILGWLPASRLLGAPRHPITAIQWEFEVDPDFLFPMPETFDFGEPPIDEIPRLWDYDKGGWWTPMGFYVYDAAAMLEVARLDDELAR